MMSEHNPNRIPIYLEASNKQTLIMLMILNNNMNGKSYNYMQPLKDGSKWVVWFYDVFTSYISVEEKMLKEDIMKKVKQ